MQERSRQPKRCTQTLCVVDLQQLSSQVDHWFIGYKRSLKPFVQWILCLASSFSFRFKPYHKVVQSHWFVKSGSRWNGSKSIGSKSLKEGNEFGPSSKNQWDLRRTDQLIGNCLKFESVYLFGQPAVSSWAQLLLSKCRRRSFKIQIQLTLISFQKAIHSRILCGEGNLNLDVISSSVCTRTRIRKDSDIRHNESQSLMQFAMNRIFEGETQMKVENFMSVCKCYY